MPAQALPWPEWRPIARGRGSVAGAAHRFESTEREVVDDGWPQDAEAAVPLPVPTQWRWEDVKSAITRNRSPDVGFDLSINPYRGCEHGCSYCYARPTHSYLGLSPGLDFETRLVARRGIAEQVAREIARPRYVPGPLALGTVTDAYQPLERSLRLSRAVLQVLEAAGHPVGIVTKGSGIERDLDLLSAMGPLRQASVYVTITTLDAALARRLEPRAPAPWRRLRTIRALADAGVPVAVSVAPQIPFINEDLEQVLAAAADAGAQRAFYSVLRLPWELAPLFRQWLLEHFPERAERVMARMHDLRGGRDYDAAYGQRMSGQGVWAALLRQRFDTACRRLGLDRERPPPDFSRFSHGAGSRQIGLF